MMCVFTVFNRLHFCEINSYIALKGHKGTAGKVNIVTPPGE